MKASWGASSGKSAEYLRSPRPPKGKRGPKHVRRAEDDRRAEALRTHLLAAYPDYRYGQFAALLGWSVSRVTVLMAGGAIYPQRVAPCHVDEAITKLKVTV